MSNYDAPTNLSCPFCHHRDTILARGTKARVCSKCGGRFKVQDPFDYELICERCHLEFGATDPRVRFCPPCMGANRKIARSRGTTMPAYLR